MTIYELQQRAVALRSKTQTASITPDEVGGLHVDTLAYLAEFEREASGLGIRKVYLTKAEMEADTSPVSTNGKTLQYSQLVCIYNEADNTNVNNGDIYAFQKPGWLRVGNISNINKLLLKIDKEEEARKKQFDDLNGLITRGLTVRFNGILDDAEISHISVSNVDGVYYISSKKIFAGKSGNRFVNNWTGADMYLNDDRTAICKDKVYLLGADVYAWNKNADTLESITVTLQKSLAEESKTRKKQFDELNGLIARGLTVRFNGIVDDAEISHISVSDIDGVYYISSKKMFAGKSGNRYVNNWTGADMYLNDDRTAICKDKVYLLGADVYAWNKNSDTLESITVTLQKSLAEESKTRKKEFDHLDDKIDDLDKDFNDSLNNFKVASVQAITASFDGFVDKVNIISSTTATIKGIYYDRIRKSFVAKTKNGEYITGSSHEGTNWMDSYFNPDGSEILKSKTYKCKSKLYCWDEAANNLVQMGDDGGLKIINHNADETTFVLTPNALHVWPEVTQLSLTFATAEDGYVGEYCFQFTCPDDAGTTLVLPVNIKWYDGRVVIPEAGKTYQASVLNNIIIMRGA